MRLFQKSNLFSMLMWISLSLTFVILIVGCSSETSSDEVSTPSASEKSKHDDHDDHDDDDHDDHDDHDDDDHKND